MVPFLRDTKGLTEKTKYILVPNFDHNPIERYAHKKVTTWLAKPIPIPRKIRPNISMETFIAAPARIEPARNAMPPIRIDDLRPKALVTDEANKEATRPAMYNEDVKEVSSWLSNLQ